MSKPTFDEAQADFSAIKEELDAMRTILDKALFLSNRQDVNSEFYLKVYYQANQHIINGETVMNLIKERYPEVS